jgi:hypothetical protein
MSTASLLGAIEIFTLDFLLDVLFKKVGQVNRITDDLRSMHANRQIIPIATADCFAVELA